MALPWGVMAPFQGCFLGGEFGGFGGFAFRGFLRDWRTVFRLSRLWAGANIST